MTRRKDDLWRPEDYDDEPRSEGNFGLSVQQQEAALAAKQRGKERRKITVEVSATVYELLEVLTQGDFPAALSVEDVVSKLIDHAQQGVYRPGSWERGWLIQAFGPDFTSQLQPGDPYGRPDDDVPVFNRPLKKPKVS
jgi:hypothetical protein